MRIKDRFKLNFPQTLGEFKAYEDAQKAVDYLAANEFPVENVMIVGTGVKLVERVVGRRTWPRVLRQGAISGIGTGLLVGLMMMLLFGADNPGLMLVMGLVIGVVMGVLMAGLTNSLAKGKRDFDSIRDTVATDFEVLVEHKVAARAHELLAKMPGYHAGMFS
ncbi:MAG: hypothetical protein GX596_00510 [Propionibacterium sp.]|nr:hypothetical protein [Propionibacterium sp.]